MGAPSSPGSSASGPVALTGATGFLGSHVALALRATGHAVRGVVRSPDKGAWLADRGVTFAGADLADEDALAAAFGGASVVLANAALGSYLGDFDAFLRTNVAGTEATLRAAARAGVPRVVYVSSVAVYRTRVRTWLREDAERYGPVRRRSWSDLTTDWRYALSKHLAEERAVALAAELGVALTIVRPGPIYGSRDTRWTARLRRMHARPVVVAPTVGVPMVHAGDVAAALVRAIERPELAGRAFTVAGPPTSLPTILRVYSRLQGRGPWILPIPVPLWVGYDTSAAAAELGFRARPLEEGLAEVVAGESAGAG